MELTERGQSCLHRTLKIAKLKIWRCFALAIPPLYAQSLMVGVIWTTVKQFCVFIDVYSLEYKRLPMKRTLFEWSLYPLVTDKQ